MRLGKAAALQIPVILLELEMQGEAPVVTDLGDDALGGHIHLDEKQPRRAVSTFSRTKSASGMMRFSGISSAATKSVVSRAMRPCRFTRRYSRSVLTRLSWGR